MGRGCSTGAPVAPRKNCGSLASLQQQFTDEDHGRRLAGSARGQIAYTDRLAGRPIALQSAILVQGGPGGHNSPIDYAERFQQQEEDADA